MRFAAAHQVSGLVLYGTSVRPPTAEAQAGGLDQALRLYAAELTRMLQPTALLDHQLAGLNLPAEQARRAWQALQATERPTYPAAALAPRPS